MNALIEILLVFSIIIGVKAFKYRIYNKIYTQSSEALN